MRVFKLYLKVLRKIMGQLILYIGIFAGVAFGILIPQAVSGEAAQYEVSKCDFALFDYDNSVASKGLTTYLENNHTRVDIKDDTKETMQDELYSRNVNAIVRIQEGYEDKFLEGNGQDALEVVMIPGTNASGLFQQNLNSFCKMVETYVKAGFDLADAFEKTIEIQDVSVKVSVSAVSVDITEREWKTFFGLLGWIFVAMAVAGIAPVLIVLDKKNLRERIACSSYKFPRMNMEILLGVLVTGLAICLIFLCVAELFLEGSIWNIQGVLYICNMICFMTVALAITFLVSKVTFNRELITMLSNLISLGMAFLCGVFVPMEVLSEGVIKVAHFLPTYWYEKAVMEIATYENGAVTEIFSYMGIQLLFAVAIIIVALAVSARKRVSRENK